MPLHYLRQRARGLPGRAQQRRIVMAGKHIGAQGPTGFVGAQFDCMLLDAVEGLQDVLAYRAVLVAARVDEVPA